MKYDDIWMGLIETKEALEKLLKVEVEKSEIRKEIMGCETSIRHMEEIIRPELSFLKISQAEKVLKNAHELVVAIKARKAKVAAVVMKNACKVAKVGYGDEEYEWYSKMSEKELNDLIEKHGDI